jgi:hypothetical protein
MHFTRSGQKQIFEIQIQIEFDSVDRGRLRGSIPLAGTVSVRDITGAVGSKGDLRGQVDPYLFEPDSNRLR